MSCGFLIENLKWIWNANFFVRGKWHLRFLFGLNGSRASLSVEVAGKQVEFFLLLEIWTCPLGVRILCFELASHELASPVVVANIVTSARLDELFNWARQSGWFASTDLLKRQMAFILFEFWRLNKKSDENLFKKLVYFRKQEKYDSKLQEISSILLFEFYVRFQVHLSVCMCMRCKPTKKLIHVHNMSTRFFFSCMYHM